MMTHSRSGKPFAFLMITLLVLIPLLWRSSGSFAQTRPPDDDTVYLHEETAPFPTDVVDNNALATVSAVGTVRTFPATMDAEVREGTPSTNYGIEVRFGAGYDGAQLRKRGLVRFDTTTYLPPGTTIHAATLRLYLGGSCNTNATGYQAYQVNDDWFEMTVNWNNQPSFSTGYGTASIPGGPPWVYYEFNVTELVEKWVDGQVPENGIMIRGPESSPSNCAYREFFSKGGGGLTAEPELVVDYTLPASALSVSSNDVQVFHQCGVGDPAPTPVVIDIESNDAKLQNWSTSMAASSWLALDKTSSKVSRLFSDELTLSFTETATCPDVLTTQVQVSAPGLTNGSQTINVTFNQVEDMHELYLPLVMSSASGLFVSNTAVSQPTTYDRVILLIGVADYENMDAQTTFSILRPGAPGFDLVGPHSDHASTSNLFAPTGNDTSTAMFTLSENNATQENIDFALDRIDKLEDADTEVIIYFSGHGGPIPDLSPNDEADGYDEILGPYDLEDVTGPPYYNPQILDDTFATQLSALETQHLAVILDACNSGGMEVLNTNRAVLAASSETQLSWESSELEHGVFTYYMLKAMIDSANDTNGDGWISVQEVYNYAASKVAQYVAANTTSQQTLTLDLTRDVRLVPVNNATMAGSPDS